MKCSTNGHSFFLNNLNSIFNKFLLFIPLCRKYESVCRYLNHIMIILDINNNDKGQLYAQKSTLSNG